MTDATATKLRKDNADLLKALRRIVNEMQVAASRGRSVGQDWLERRIAVGRDLLARIDGEER